jgi:hypothetical protein
MKNSNDRPDVLSVLDGLKDFQRDTVEYIFRRMYTDADYTRRFLLADEAGLGKTIVAKGLIAKVVDYLWDNIDRIDVVYICSNSDIARQNINRLNITKENQLPLATRITLLPIHVCNLKSRRVNFVSFTPGTSFDMHSSMGIAQERALLYKLIKGAWDIKGAPPVNILRGNMQQENFRYYLSEISKENIDIGLSEKFISALAKKDLKPQFEDLCRFYTREDRKIPEEVAQKRAILISDLRNLLAYTCLYALEPDLIILDEFQRFKNLLTGQDEAANLARYLFEYSDEKCKSRVLLLSATPYKMYTMNQELSEEDHYEDFLNTLQFLSSDSPRNLDDIKGLLSEYRHELFQIDVQRSSRLRQLTKKIENALCRVMVRTERLAASDDRSGMLIEVRSPHNRLHSNDLKSYLTLEQIAEELSLNSPMEYWKSSPYLLNFMEDYVFKRAFEEALKNPDGQSVIRRTLKHEQSLLLPWDDIKSYKMIDPQNSRLRSLIAETIDTGAWQLLWMPPSLPYYLPEGPFADVNLQNFTKRLVFSSWRVVPKVIATLLSYEVERRMFRAYDERATNREEDREKRRPLLRFTRSRGRLTGMALMSLLYPCITLAHHFDPLAEYLASDSLLTPKQIVEKFIQRAKDLLSKLNVNSITTGPEDERWYWAAPVLLDVFFFPESARQWLNRSELPFIWASKTSQEEEALDQETEERSAWTSHVQQLQNLATEIDSLELGRQPEDLPKIISFLAIGGMAVCALRSLGRLTGDVAADFIRDQAARTGLSFITLFNLPEVTALIRGFDRTEPYWQRVVEYCIKGNLQSVLDEYFHNLRDSMGLMSSTSAEIAKQIADEVIRALTLRTSSMQVDTISIGERSIQQNSNRMRGRFALRFGDQTDERGDSIARAGQVQTAFNSPFWPFVIATTSVGQEGLDFHTYCHAVVHWNLPANPVDLEQREGRIHRYKGHAIRKNLARELKKPIKLDQLDIWTSLFNLAKQSRPEGTNDLVPFWIYSTANGARIERHVPALPLSRDAQHLEFLRRSLVAYRMVFGQSRQEDMLNFLLERLPRDQIKSIAESIRIDLSPKKKH